MLSRFFVISVLLAGFVVIGCGTPSSKMDLEGFKKALGLTGEPYVVLTKAKLYEKVGKPEKVQMIGNKAYLYYTVSEGSVQIVVDKAGYEMDDLRFGDAEVNLY